MGGRVARRWVVDGFLNPLQLGHDASLRHCRRIALSANPKQCMFELVLKLRDSFAQRSVLFL